MTAAPNPPTARRWLAAGGMRIDLIHATHTTGNRDGWWLVLRHPDTQVVLSECRVNLDHPDPAKAQAAAELLASSLAAVRAVPVLPRRGGA